MLNSFKEYNYCFFYMMGKYFSRKEIIKEMDCQLYSNENMTWYIRYDTISDIKGFASIEDRGKYLYLDNFYVIKKYRGQRYSKEILEKILENNKGKKIKLITRNEIAKKLFEKYGFYVYAENGRYYKMEINNT